MFQESFKYFKARNPQPSFENVIDLCDEEQKGLDTRLKRIPITATSDARYPGLINSNKWRIFELVDRPGLIIISNPFTKLAQRYWMDRSISDYPKYPNHTNLPANIVAKYSSYDGTDDQRQHFDWWTTAQSIDDPQERGKFSKALRWATLGYHYDWTNKIYDEAARNVFPADLAGLSRHFAEVLGFEKFLPEAAIVNYYPVGSTLAGHTDHSEKNLEAPLFSFSFGQPAIFLIGGPSKDERPDALLLRSGDVIVMTRSSRLCYHAVPKVFHCADSAQRRWTSGDGPEEKDDEGEEPEVPKCSSAASTAISTTVWNDCRQTGSPHHWSAFADYISNSRININIRQVLNEGENHL